VSPKGGSRDPFSGAGRRELRQRVKKGARVGLRMGALLVALGTIGTVLQSVWDSRRALDALAVVGMLAVLYLGGGALAGAIVGLLLPITRSRLGLFIAIALALAPMVAATLYIVEGFQWTSDAAITFLIVVPALAGALTVSSIVLGVARRHS